MRRTAISLFVIRISIVVGLVGVLTIPGKLAANVNVGRSATGVTMQQASFAPTISFAVEVFDPDCRRSGEPLQSTYDSINEAVKDTIPGEWWPANSYGVPMVNGALCVYNR